MKIKLIFILSFSFCLVFAQEKDSIKVKNKYQPNITAGVDVLNAAMAAFSDRKLFQGYVSTKIKKNLHAILDVGFEKNIYQKGGYDASANGLFAKIGGYYMLSMDEEDKDSGFYAGAKIAGSFYTQEYKSVPVRAYGGGDAYLSFPSSSQSAYWIEGFVGARVQLFKSKFYVDVNAQPRYLAYTTKQEEMIPMIVPGFGKSSNKFNVGFSWNLAYQF
jgi:hypothetical protein